MVHLLNRNQLGTNQKLPKFHSNGDDALLKNL
jgi:hypothetical protein